MFEKIIAYSLKNKIMVLLMIVALIFAGVISLRSIAIDAVPDITNNQVQVVTSSPTLAAEEVEKFITFPIEMSVANIPDVTEVRSISRYGLSVVTIVFEDNVDIMRARQFVAEQLIIARDEIPAEFGTPQMMPITTGLGEIYQYVLQVQPGYEKQFDIMEIRTIQDWIVKRQLAGLQGIIEVSSFGGKVKQYEVGVNPASLMAFNVTINEVEEALKINNNNSGGSYIEKGANAFYIRTEGRAENFTDIENIIIKNEGTPVRIKDIATVGLGSPKRYGAMTMDGKGEVVGGITLMLKGANSSDAVEKVQERMALIQKSLPKGVEIYPYLDRSVLVGKTINTVLKNLIEGGLIVIFVLVLFLGNFRAGLIVSSVIPLAMLFALILMNLLGVSANLMSLGAIDFGIVVDGAVIIVEGVLHVLHVKHKGKTLSAQQMNNEIKEASSQIYNTAAFGVLIILVVFVPIFALEGIEGKTFLPMAQTVSFAILGSLLLSVTYVPVASALFLNKTISDKETFSDKIVNAIQKKYVPSLKLALNHPKKVLSSAVIGLLLSVLVFSFMGSEFIPTLEEGDLAMQMAVEPGSSLEKSVATSTRAEKILKENFPEVKHVVSKIGTAEVPTDPMAIEDADIMILLKAKEEWKTAETREELIAKMKEKLAVIKDASFEFTQPIQLRFNELMTGAKTDIAIQIFGEDVKQLKHLADETALFIKNVNGVGDVKVEQTDGLKQLSIVIDRPKLALHHINVDDVNNTIKAAYGGSPVGSIYENERNFDLVVRLNSSAIQTLSLNKLFVTNDEGDKIPLAEVATIKETIAPMQISREDAKRRITIGVNVRDRDVASLVEEIQTTLDAKLTLPPGYTIKYGGQFENLQNALNRLQIVVPVALLFILLLLYIAFDRVKESLIIFMAVPLASIGGILALWMRGMPFSISAGIGFIALFGVAVLNGIVLINEFVRLKQQGSYADLKELIIAGANSRLRPVLMTALVASLGFLPMALATSNGAEVQRPLATVVIGGLITSTLLTLLVLPALYYLFSGMKKAKKTIIVPIVLVALLFPFSNLSAQNEVGLSELITSAQQNRPEVKLVELEKQQWESERKNSYTIQPLQVGVQHGQNDGKAMDTYIEVMQDIGSPWSISTKRRYAQMGIDFASQKAKTVEQEVKYNITSSYYNWLYYKNALQLVQQVSELLSDAEKNNQQMLKVGEINNTDYLLIQQLNNSMRQKIQFYFSGTAKNEQELLYLSGLDAKVKDTVLTALPIQLNATLSNSLYSENELKIKQLEQQQKVIKSAFQPTFQLGYFNQSLDKVNNFQGIKGGLVVPLFFGGKRNELTINRLQQETITVQQNNLKKQLANELKLLEQNILMMQKTFEGKQPNMIENIKGLEQLQQKLNLGEINTFDFIKLSSIVIDGSLSELEMLNNYNQNVIKYQFLTTNF
ncbi:MAG: CusA/CzcA family heavy metal efflux RND transporter [Flavobacteriales bacterium]|nr:MAG: CusA/CzcA family heavy metal efflux RND transporter [Flavobacteriales bacterium]